MPYFIVTFVSLSPTVTTSSPSNNAAWISVTYWCNSALSLDSLAFVVNWEYPTTDTVAKIAKIAITTNSSTNVKPFLFKF